jgi:hypothetical protein
VAEKHTPLTEMRLAEMMAVMRTLQWQKGITGPVFAEKWGLSLTRIEHLSAEAWRRVKAEVNDPDRVGATVGTAIEQVMIEALNDKGGERNQSRKIVVEAAKVWAAIAGANAPTKTELTGKDGAPLAISLDRLLEAKAVGDENETGDAGTVPDAARTGEEPEG